YTALTLSSPERVRFRYRLEGVDSDWIDADARRVAFYNNVKPGAYTFRVSASMGEDEWRESSALSLEPLPYFYKTIWFLILASMAVMSLAYSLYRLRLRQSVDRIQAGFQERMQERTRIARDLHDPLLQSFQGVLMHFSTLKYMIPDRPAEAVEW